MALMSLHVHDASAGVIISEIMFDPQGSDRDSTGPTYTFNREWTELYNNTSAAIDISGWQFGDAQDNEWATPFPGGTIIGAGQALVVTGDTASFDANWGTGINRIQVGAFPNQANSIGNNEAAAIRNAAGVIQDSVRYQDVGWPEANGSDGNSVYLLPQALNATANDQPSNWRPSSAGIYGARWVNAGGQGENHGSPGYVATTPQSPFAPSPDAAWSMVVFPDTQNYAKDTANLPIFFQMTNWIKDHRDEYKIKLVLQEGDIVNQNSQVAPTSGDQSADQQWANARDAMGVLNGVVPYIMAVGNHDLGTTSAQNRNTQFNTYFPPYANPLNDPAKNGVIKGIFPNEPGHYENTFSVLNAPDGRNLLIFSLEFWPRQAVLDWAKSVASLPQFANYSAVLLTHSYLGPNGTRQDESGSEYGVGAGGDFNTGEDLWQELVRQTGNFEMTFSGHVGGDGVAYRLDNDVTGNGVDQMLINAQFEANGGNGTFRLLEFLNDGKTVRVRTYSPFLDLQRTDSANAYTITLTQIPMTPGDFNADGSVNGSDLAIWKANAGLATGAVRITGDADADGDVDGRDFLIWQRNVGVSAVPTNNVVPEPAALLLTALAAIFTLVARHCRPRHRRRIVRRLQLGWEWGVNVAGHMESAITSSLVTPAALAIAVALPTPASALDQLIIAHRGASHDAPENTLASFNLAWKQGADGIEADFYLSKDGQIVCSHDPDTERTAGVKHRIVDTTWAVLKKLDVGSWKNVRYRGEHIPLFKDVAALVPAGKRFFIELKTGPEIVAPLAKALDESKLDRKNLVIICFNADTIAECERVLPDLTTHWLVRYEEKSGQWTPTMQHVAAGLAKCHADMLGSQAQPKHVDAAFIKGLCDAGHCKFGVWTVDDPKVARFYQSLGAKTITTNRPGWLRKQLEAPAPAPVGAAAGG